MDLIISLNINNIYKFDGNNCQINYKFWNLEFYFTRFALVVLDLHASQPGIERITVDKKN